MTIREGETVVIGDPASPTGTVRLQKVDGEHRSVLVFQFPRDIPVNREKVAAQIVASRKASAHANPTQPNPSKGIA